METPATVVAARATQRTGTDAVWQRAATDPDATALVELREHGADRVLGWRELADRADRTATVLAGLGVRAGDTVVVQLPNSADFVTVSLAVLRVGAVVCPVLPGLRAPDLAHILTSSLARVMVVPAAFRGRCCAVDVTAMAAAGRTAALRHVLVAQGPAPAGPVAGRRPGRSRRVAVHQLDADIAAVWPHGAAPSPARLSPHDLALLLFTSGTTGEPKGVPHRTAALDRAAHLAAGRLRLTAGDRVHIAAPMADHSGFLYGMWLALLLGAVQIVQPVWDAGRALRAIQEWGGTCLPGTPSLLLDLADAVDSGAPAPRSLCTFVATGCAVPRTFAARARGLSQVRVCVAWGSAETFLATLSAPDDDPDLLASTGGRPLDGVRLRVTDDSGAVLGPECEGQVELTGPSVFEGYLDRPDLTGAAFTDDGWYRTGDLGVVQPSGHLRITGRVADRIDRGGVRIPAALIEQAMAAHPAVRECAVVGVPDPQLGERACLVAVLHPGATLDLDGVRHHLDGHRVAQRYWPERVEITDRLPRNPAGTVRTYLLREYIRHLSAGHAGGSS